MPNVQSLPESLRRLFPIECVVSDKIMRMGRNANLAGRTVWAVEANHQLQSFALVTRKPPKRSSTVEPELFLRMDLLHAAENSEYTLEEIMELVSRQKVSSA